MLTADLQMSVERSLGQHYKIRMLNERPLCTHFILTAVLQHMLLRSYSARTIFWGFGEEAERYSLVYTQRMGRHS